MANAKHLCKINAKRPEIKHPLSRFGNPQTLSVRGVSRADGWRDSPGTEKSPKQAENLLNTLTNDRIDQLDSWKSLDRWVNLDKKYLEKNGKEEKEDTHKYDNTQLEVQCEELEYQLLEKINYGGFYDLKHLFLSSDPEHRGRVRRDALLVILTTFLGRYISDQQFHHLLQRLELGDKQVITFDAFYDYFKKPEINDPPEWLDPLKRKKKLVMKTANQVHLDLKEVANTSFFELLKLFPKDRLNSSGFCAALSKLGISMTEKEFDKLWDRYVKEAEGSLDIEELLCNLGVKSARDKNEHCGQLLLSGLEKVTGGQQIQQTKTNKTVLSKMGAEKKQSLSIEKWLKEKFREGARSMVTEFLVYDTDNSSKVLKEDFLKVLGKFQLHLTGEQLDQFLVRCGLNERSPFINYLEFLQRLQSRSKNALSHTVLWRTGHRFGEKKASHVLEDKLLRLFHDDFNSLLQSFKKADIKQLNVITPEAFRSIIEAKYCIKLSDENFECLVGKLPLDGHGSIRYLDFMAKFDSSEGRLSIFDDSKTILTDYSRNANVKNMSCKGKKATQKERTAEQLTEIIKNIVKNNYESLESAFNQIDAMNTRRLTLESIYQLLKRCDIDPPISRKETSKFWQSFILNQDKTVDYYQFVRHFGFSMKSSCFPNAKISPPIKGDVDFMIRSRKLNCDTKIIANILQAKVEISVEDLWNLFKELDPSNSGCVTTEEFIDILQDLSPDLSKHQCDSLVAKFAHGKDRISYAKFLKPYQSHRTIYKQNINKTPKQEEKAIQQGLNTITYKFRQKLSSTEWKNLHKACQKMDANGSGFLLLPEFRSVVKLCNMVLDEDDIYQIMSHYDKDLAGKINYSKLVSDHSKINRKES